ncbi:MAG: tripartite tricarboxylate transporter substrate binding protein [Betaproteobacteria bacterium]|nr:tripartite tricarboxylate transporter substrate binding protein [Betaproteobacteria bacterium]
MNTWIAKILLVLALCGTVSASLAQGYPSKPIHIVVGFPPGGGTDILARLVGAKLQETWSQPVIIDNKPGANSIIATEHVAKSAPDGYTLLANGTNGMAILPVLSPKLPYDSVKDFAPISILGLFPLVLVVHPSVPARTVQELTAHLKANPGKLNYSSATTAFHVATEMFKQMTGTSVNHIPFKGSAQSVNAVVANTTQMTIIDMPPTMQLVKGGRLRALGVTTAKRVSIDATIPTLAESGVPGYDMEVFVGLFAPAATPADIVAKLTAEAMRIVRLPDVREKLLSIGIEPVGSTAEQMGDAVKAGIAKFREVVRAGNIKAE